MQAEDIRRETSHSNTPNAMRNLAQTTDHTKGEVRSSENNDITFGLRSFHGRCKLLSAERNAIFNGYREKDGTRC